MLSALKEIIPGAEAWPRFVRNRSDQFEARLAMVEIAETPSVLLAGMAAHASRSRWRTARGGWSSPPTPTAPDSRRRGLVAARFVDHRGRATERYPENPNGSFHGITGVTTTDGRVTLFMPHPERVFRAVQHSWRPAGWREDGPWMRIFRNARIWVD